MAKITESLSASIKEKVFGVVKAKASSGESPDALLKVISKNFMAMSAMARDMNVASQNIKELVRVMGGKPSDKEDKVAGSGLTADERERKLAVELEKDKPKEESKKPSLVSKLGKKALDKFKATKVGKKVTDKFAELKKAFNPAKIFKALTKYLVIGAIIGVIFVAFKDTFVEWATGLFDAIKTKFDEFTASIGQWFQDTTQNIIDKAKELITPIVDAIKSFVEKISQSISEKIQMLAEQFPQTFAFIKKIIDKVFVLIDGAKKVASNIKSGVKNLFGKKPKEEPIDDTAERAKLERQQKEALETERIKKLEKEKQYTGDDEIVRKRLDLPEKTETMRREAEAAKAPTPTPAPAPAPTPAPAPAPTPAPAPAAAPAAPKAKPKAPSAAPAPAPSAPSGAQKPTAEPAEIPGGVPGLIVNELNKAGITSSKAHANVLATVKAESDFVPKNESLFYTKVEGILGTFGKRAGPKEVAQQYVSSKGDNRSEQLANVVYAKTDGNSEPGDGYKYRGRGFIQHTGKNQYKALAKGSGIDVVSNPDALNSPEVAAKVVPWFFLNYKGLKVEDMDKMSKVNQAVAFADATRTKGYIGDKAVKREALAASYESKIASGQSIEEASKGVASGQRQQQKSQTPVVVNAPTTNTQVVKKTQVASSKRSDVGSSLANAAA